MKKTQLYLLAAVLVAAGLLAFFYKWKVLKFPVMPVEQTEVWEVQARVEYSPRKRANKLVLQLPADPPGYAILDQTFIARNYGMNIERAKSGDEREVHWQIRNASGSQALYYRATIYHDAHASDDDTKPAPLEPVVLAEPEATAAQALLEQVREKSVDSASFAGELVRRLHADPPSDEVKILRRGIDDLASRAKLAVALLGSRQIAARIVHALDLSEPRSRLELTPLLQIYDTDAQRWKTVDARTGVEGLPAHMLVWSRSEKPVLIVEDNPKARVEFSVQRSIADALETAVARLEIKDQNLVAYSLLNLPLHAQEVYRILLLVPLGAFIMLLLRNLVGIKTFGTFMPVLIALAFRWTELTAGIVLFVIVVSLGLLVRFYLERLRLLLVPRLTAVLIVVVLLMAAISVVSNRLGVEVGLSIALFPMIIMTMTIERISVAWDERGPTYAIREGLGSLAIAALAYLVMSNRFLEHLIFVFPELLLVLLGITLLLGRYSGYRLTELMRFRALAKETA